MEMFIDKVSIDDMMEIEIYLNKIYNWKLISCITSNGSYGIF